MLGRKNTKVVAAILSIVLIALTIIGATYSQPPVVAESSEESAVMEAVQRDLPTLKRVIANLGHSHYGLSDRGEVEALQPGLGAEVYALTPEALKAYDPEHPLGAQVSPSCQWQVPLLAGNQPKLMLTVAFFQGRWQIVEIGGAQLASRWHAFTRSAAATHAAEFELTHAIKLVKVRPLGATFALFESSGGETMVVLSAYGGTLTEIEHLKPYRPDQLIALIKDVVKRLEDPTAQ